MFVYDSIHDFKYINMNKYNLIYKLSMIIELDTKWLLLTVKDLAANQQVWYWIEMQFTFTDLPNKFEVWFGLIQLIVSNQTSRNVRKKSRSETIHFTSLFFGITNTLLCRTKL